MSGAPRFAQPTPDLVIGWTKHNTLVSHNLNWFSHPMTDHPNDQPEWNTELRLSLTPAQLTHSAFYSARSVHTGTHSCIEPEYVVFELNAADTTSGNHARFVEQEYASDEDEDDAWHDWSVEVCIGNTYVTAHWQIPMDVGPADWDWCLQEAEKAFERVCLLLGKRVRKGLAIETPEDDPDQAALGFQNPAQERPRHH